MKNKALAIRLIEAEVDPDKVQMDIDRINKEKNDRYSNQKGFGPGDWSFESMHSWLSTASGHDEDNPALAPLVRKAEQLVAAWGKDAAKLKDDYDQAVIDAKTDGNVGKVRSISSRMISVDSSYAKKASDLYKQMEDEKEKSREKETK